MRLTRLLFLLLPILAGGCSVQPAYAQASPCAARYNAVFEDGYRAVWRTRGAQRADVLAVMDAAYTAAAHPSDELCGERLQRFETIAAEWRQMGLTPQDDAAALTALRIRSVDEAAQRWLSR